MNRLLLSTCILLVITSSVMGQVSDVAPTAAADPSSWKRYTAMDEAFSIIFPTVPAMATSREYFENGQRERRIREIGAYADGIVYTVYSVENPGPKQSLERFIKERFGNFKTREVTVSGVAGKEPVDQKGDLVRKYFATERHLYVFSTLGAPASDPRVQQFFSSLVLGKNREGIEVSDGPGITLQPPVQAEPVDANIAPKSYVGREVDRKVRLGMKPQPTYTNAARLNGLTGTVVLKVIFSSAGEVKNIRTVSGLPYGLTEKAIDAARKIKFIPAVKEGKYVSVWMQLEYNFNLF
ncbi:MAG TPA: energy transducer TonB [Pyrinomonadaceae bacterium]|nr:energy transducer TonB [Pyrinomonadaceae bacterium]